MDFEVIERDAHISIYAYAVFNVIEGDKSELVFFQVFLTVRTGDF